MTVQYRTMDFLLSARRNTPPRLRGGDECGVQIINPAKGGVKPDLPAGRQVPSRLCREEDFITQGEVGVCITFPCNLSLYFIVNE